MAMEKYGWDRGEIPIIEVHSIKKHDVLREYLRQYILIVGGKPFQRRDLTLTIVDGFAGGGLYQTASGTPYFGSPFVCLRTVEEAAFLLSQQKPFTLNSNFIFVEKNKRVATFLKNTLESEGYKSRLDKNLFVVNASFEDKIEEIIQYIEQHTGTARRCIFVLDQYGYSDVSLIGLSKVFARLPKAEVILTFAVDFLLDYLTNSSLSNNIFQSLGIEFDLSRLNCEKAQRGWRKKIQKDIYRGLIETVRPEFYTNFFVKSRESNKSYWILHLSMHMKARDEMLALHCPEGHLKIPHLWPGQNPPGDSRKITYQQPAQWSIAIPFSS
jgi:three-Cys-motif partner protein